MPLEITVAKSPIVYIKLPWKFDQAKTFPKVILF